MTQEQQHEIAKQFESIGFEHKKVINEVKTTLEQRIAEIEKKGYADPETKEKLDRVSQHLDELDAKISAPDNRLDKISQRKGITDMYVADPVFREMKKLGFRKQDLRTIEIPGGFFPIEQKTPIQTSNIGYATSGVQNYQRFPGLIDLQRANLTIRDLLSWRPLTTGNGFDWVKQNVATRLASPQVEGAAKAESTVTYTTATDKIHTVAHFIQTSRQVLDDVDWLRPNLDSELMYGLKHKEDTELLTGDGLADHINGLVTQATAYAGTYAVGTDQKLDKIRHFILEARLSYFPVDALVMAPKDLHDIELIKDETGGVNKGKYVIGDPFTGASVTMVWGKPVVESDSMVAGKLLAGSFALGAFGVDRQQATIDISYEHNLNFTTNQVTLLAEERVGLAVIRPAAFVYGTI